MNPPYYGKVKLLKKLYFPDHCLRYPDPKLVSHIPPRNARSAFGAIFRRPFQLMIAAGTGSALLQWLSTLGAKPGAGRWRLTMRTGCRNGILNIIWCCQNNAPPSLTKQLALRPLSTSSGAFFFKSRSAIFADAILRIPAHFRAHPSSTPLTLMEILLGLLNRNFKSTVPLRTTEGIL